MGIKQISCVPLSNGMRLNSIIWIRRDNENREIPAEKNESHECVFSAFLLLLLLFECLKYVEEKKPVRRHRKSQTKIGGEWESEQLGERRLYADGDTYLYADIHIIL